ncbi:DUF6252 family protein [Pedobacter miscanthi]|uniref:DUF6252 family protein n=1 Tax=Pedobacter miscanthi TaxID=2259170 RepID=UPI00292ED7D4|nr:DUF6252 family protein [Pedobacter miscanthi]
MKVLFKFSLLALVCLLITSSCRKEIDYHPEWDSSSMSGKVDGVLLQCTIATAQTYAIGGKTIVQISGNKGITGFSLMINDFKGVGTYSLSDNMAIYLLSTSGLQDAYTGTSSGTIKITSYLADQYIKGTFEFKGENYVTSATKSITEGQFSISLIPTKIPESNNSTNNLSAKVDGTVTGFTGEASSVISPFGKLLTITTFNGDKRLLISIIDYKGVGTYDIANDGTGVYMKDQGQTGSFYADAGTLIITSEAGNKLKGTFFFSGGNQNTTIKTSVNITDGTFDLPFTKL